MQIDVATADKAAHKMPNIRVENGGWFTLKLLPKRIGGCVMKTVPTSATKVKTTPSFPNFSGKYKP